MDSCINWELNKTAHQELPKHNAVFVYKLNAEVYNTVRHMVHAIALNYAPIVSAILVLDKSDVIMRAITDKNGLTFPHVLAYRQQLKDDDAVMMRDNLLRLYRYRRDHLHGMYHIPDLHEFLINRDKFIKQMRDPYEYMPQLFVLCNGLSDYGIQLHQDMCNAADVGIRMIEFNKGYYKEACVEPNDTTEVYVRKESVHKESVSYIKLNSEDIVSLPRCTNTAVYKNIATTQGSAQFYGLPRFQHTNRLPCDIFNRM